MHKKGTVYTKNGKNSICMSSRKFKIKKIDATYQKRQSHAN